MYYKIDNKVYAKEGIAGMTFDEANKPEPLFTLEQAMDIFQAGTACGVGEGISMDRYFKQQFNVSI